MYLITSEYGNPLYSQKEIIGCVISAMIEFLTMHYTMSP